MTAKDIFGILMDEAVVKRESTCDKLISGDPDKEVKKVGTCFKLTAELIERASNESVDMIITHEPTFSCGDAFEAPRKYDICKKMMLDESGIAVYRFHDHAHLSEPDYIHAGFLQTVGLKIKRKHQPDSMGITRYELDEELTVSNLAVRIRERLGVEFVRIIGRSDLPLKTVCLGLGGVGAASMSILFETDADVFVTGETGEVLDAAYIRDACYFGEEKAVILLGHYSSEYAGMRYLAETINKRLLPAVFLESGEMYHGI